MGLKLIWNDIFKEKADALVTPASRNARVGTGLDYYVHEIGGNGLDAARLSLGRIAPGNVEVTPSFGLKSVTGAKWVIHALGPVWSKSSAASVKLILDGCYLRILLKAAELGCGSVAMPVFSSGKFGMPMGLAVDVAVKAIKDFLAAFPAMEVKLVGIDEDFRDHAAKKYPELFTGKLTDEECPAIRNNYGERADDPRSTEDAFELGKEDDIFGEQLLERIVGDGKFKGMFQRLWANTQKHAKDANLPSTRSELADKSGLSHSTVKHLCSGGGEVVRTTKDKIIALSVAMKLPLEYLEKFLATCGYMLRHDGRDGIIRDFFERGCGNGIHSELDFILDSRKADRLDLVDKEALKKGEKLAQAVKRKKKAKRSKK